MLPNNCQCAACVAAWKADIGDTDGRGIVKHDTLSENIVCSMCKGKGIVETYFDAGDHFSMGSSPFSGWEKSKCTRCNGTGRVTG